MNLIAKLWQLKIGDWKNLFWNKISWIWNLFNKLYINSASVSDEVDLLDSILNKSQISEEYFK